MMIELTQWSLLYGYEPMVIKPELITLATISSTPAITAITIKDRGSFYVKESPQEVMALVNEAEKEKCCDCCTRARNITD